MDKNKWIWNSIIALQLVVYIVLTTSIFVLQKKIEILEKKNSDKEKYIFTNNEKNDSIDVSHTDKRKVDTYTKTDIQTTIKNYEEKIVQDSEDMESLFKMAVLYMGQSGQEQKALKSFEKILEKEPNHHAKKNIELWMKNVSKKITEQEIITMKRMVILFERKIQTETNEKNKKIFEEQLKKTQEKLLLLEQK